MNSITYKRIVGVCFWVAIIATIFAGNLGTISHVVAFSAAAIGLAAYFKRHS